MVVPVKLKSFVFCKVIKSREGWRRKKVPLPTKKKTKQQQQKPGRKEHKCSLKISKTPSAKSKKWKAANML